MKIRSFFTGMVITGSLAASLLFLHAQTAVVGGFNGSIAPVAQSPPVVQPPATSQPSPEKEQLPKKVIEGSIGAAYARHLREKEQPPESAVFDMRIPCPLCGQRIKVSDLKQGENWCPHCFQKFIAE